LIKYFFKKQFDGLVCTEFDGKAESRDEVEVGLNHEVVLAEANFFVEGDLGLVAGAEFVDEGAVDSTIILLIKFKSFRNIFWII
jgi:hypothetical protein